jgi:putative oxidoreductase
MSFPMQSGATAAPSIQSGTWLVVARIMMSLVFIHSGFGKIVGFAAFSDFLSRSGVPWSPLFAAGAVLTELGVGACLAIGFRTRWAAWALAAFTVAATVIGHPFWAGGPAADGHLLQALKNASIFGGLLAIALAQGAFDAERRTPGP